MNATVLIINGHITGMSVFDKFVCTIVQWDQFFLDHVSAEHVSETPWPKERAERISADFRAMLRRLQYTPPMVEAAGRVFDTMCGTGLQGSVLSSTATIIVAMSWMVRDHPDTGVARLEYLNTQIAPL